MPTTMKSPHGYFSLRLLGVCLCAAVFVWGFQAKLSLYHLAAPLNPEHVAKLMVDNQGTKASVAAISSRGNSATAAAWIKLGPVMPGLRSVRVERNDRPVHCATAAHRQAQFIRPPPPFV